MIEELLNNADFKFVFRTEAKDLWSDVYKELEFKPIDYQNFRIDYLAKYHTQNYTNIKDLSIVILSDNKPIGIWPLIACFKKNSHFLFSNDQSITPPLFKTDCSSKTIKKCLLESFNFLKNSGCNFNISIPYFGESKIMQWHQICLLNGMSSKINYNLYVDLYKELDEIKKSFRKSYKPLIGVAKKLWTTVIHDKKLTKCTWAEFKNLHYEVAGKKTRLDDTWDLQYENIKNDNAFFISLREDSSKMVGGGYFELSPNEGKYEVGVYDRELFDKPLGHIIQNTAIQELKRRGIRFYKIGRRFYESDNPQPTDKELSISYFKEGFASETYPEYILEYVKK